MEANKSTGSQFLKHNNPIVSRVCISTGTHLRYHRFFSTNAGTPKSKPSPDVGEVSSTDKIKMILQEYGKVAILSHSTIWALSLAGTYAAFRTMDMQAIIQMLPASIASHIDPSAGAFAVAFVLVKLTGPLRLMVDVAIVPSLAARLRNTFLAGPLGLRKPADMSGGQAGGRGADSYREVHRLVAPLARGGRDRLKARARSAMANTRARWQRLSPPGRAGKPPPVPPRPGGTSHGTGPGK